MKLVIYISEEQEELKFCHMHIEMSLFSLSVHSSQVHYVIKDYS